MELRFVLLIFTFCVLGVEKGTLCGKGYLQHVKELNSDHLSTL